MTLLRLYWLFHNLKLDVTLFFQFKRRRKKRALIRDICSLEGSKKHLDYYECCKIPVLEVRLDHMKKRPKFMTNFPFCDDCMYFSSTDPICLRWKMYLPEAMIHCEGQDKESVVKRYDFNRKIWISIPYGSDEHLERSKRNK